MATLPELRPLTLGEILDVGIGIYTRHWRALVAAVAVVYVPLQIVSTAIAFAIVPDPFQLGARRTRLSAAETSNLLGAELVISVVTGLGLSLAVAACFKGVGDGYLGTAPSTRRSLAFGLRRALPVFGLYVVVALSLSVSLVVLVGTLRWFGAVAFVAFAGWLATVWILAIPAMVFEQAGVFAALRRSRGLVKDRFWSAFLIWFLTALLAFVLLFVIGLVLGAVLGKGSSDATSTGIASVVMTSVAVIAMTPAFTAILAVLYFDQRVRREGFDLRLMARELGESEPAETPEPEPEPAAPAAEWQPPRPPEYPPRGGL